jgi:hypothetical protein
MSLDFFSLSFINFYTYFLFLSPLRRTSLTPLSIHSSFSLSRFIQSACISPLSNFQVIFHEPVVEFSRCQALGRLSLRSLGRTINSPNLTHFQFPQIVLWKTLFMKTEKKKSGRTIAVGLVIRIIEEQG